MTRYDEWRWWRLPGPTAAHRAIGWARFLDVGWWWRAAVRAWRATG